MNLSKDQSMTKRGDIINVSAVQQYLKRPTAVTINKKNMPTRFQVSAITYKTANETDPIIHYKHTRLKRHKNISSVLIYRMSL